VAHDDLDRLDDDFIDEMFRVNCRGAYACARALAPKLRVVALSPGFVDTGFVTRNAKWIKVAAAGSVMKTAVPPEALGDAVVAIVTKMPYSTGCYIPVDGGKI
jgi:3-oxoacyl-[acyl-carrier protein] reductase